MLEYVYPQNIDDRVLKRADHILRNHGLVAIPTDSSWSITCSINSDEAIEKLKGLKGGIKDYTLSVLCASISQIDQIVNLSTANFKIIKKHLPGPYVFILPAKKHIEKLINMKRVEIGVRIPDHPIPQALLQVHDLPLFAVTASKMMTNKEWWDDHFALENLFDQGWQLEDIKEIDMIIDTGEDQVKQLTTVVDLTEDNPVILREGIGTTEQLR